MIVLDTHVLCGGWTANEGTSRARRVRRSNSMASATSFLFPVCRSSRLRRLNAAAACVLTFPHQSGLRRFNGCPSIRSSRSQLISRSAGQFGESFPGDPADRMIAATALLRGVPLVTHDERLREVEYLKTVW